MLNILEILSNPYLLWHNANSKFELHFLWKMRSCFLEGNERIFEVFHIQNPCFPLVDLQIDHAPNVFSKQNDQKIQILFQHSLILFTLLKAPELPSNSSFLLNLLR